MADRRLQVFHAVAKHLSFTKAAEALFMTQPAVTFQIKQLEEHYNTRLFDRGHGRISLTPAGVVVQEYAERILGLSAELETRLKEMTGEVAGPLLVGASTTIAEFLLPRVLGEFKSSYPKVVPRLFVANSEAVQDRVVEHTLDIGFIEAATHHPSVVTDVCCEDELHVVCAPSHPLAKLKTVAPKVLAQYPFISREPGSGTREVIDQYFLKAGIRPDSMQVVMELGSPEALKGLAATGLGFTIMSRAAVTKETGHGELVRLPLSPRLIRNFSVVYPKERFRSRLVNTFVKFAKDRIAAAQAE
ncbi:MAG: LysR family transcriptional regulator [Betaproteobacteria bacterium RIFCSPHIGHO2_12_FULL_69_13]|nr:MAG: LysR family transcriptional regulator [Betaproteobacteria bacterium RIFCSPHIGHO2_12_FULL_69_13]OGA64629.1 MAG: LysR family transcriptional regulator [Betaproteobacteria bacterium RIFCSPLOWO2_12_FULL_68_20]